MNEGVGGCNNWLSGSGSNLNALLVSQQAMNVSLISYDDNSETRVLKTCNDKVSSGVILSAINAATTATTATITTLTTCKGTSQTWKSRKCTDLTTALCVDCIDPCGRDECPSMNTLNPCGATNGNIYGCPATNVNINGYRVFTATFVPISVAPRITSIVVIPAESSFRVVVSLQSSNNKPVDGTVYCAQYVTGVVPISVTDIVLQNQFATSAFSIATVNIGGLFPQSNYDIYCVSQSNLGTLISLVDALKLRASSKTIGFKSVNILVSIQSLYVGFKSVNSIQVTLDALPSSSLTLSLGTRDMSTGAVSTLVPASIDITNAIQTKGFTFSITQASSITAGILQVTAALLGPSAKEYLPVFILRNNFTVISLNVAPPVPVFLSIRFSNDGTTLSALFDADTNQGSITASSFVCSLLFEFPGVAGATCSWTSPSVVTISPGSGASIAVGSSVTLLGGVNKIKAFCLNFPPLPGQTPCVGYNNVVTTLRKVLVPLRAVRPVVQISAPSRIGLCDKFVLDITGSSGGGGRAFTSISFNVSASNIFHSIGAKTAQTFFMTQYVVNPPTAVPLGTFPSGLNNVMVTVCNFLGMCGIGAQQLTVLTL
jgi:hypothetical protein